MPVIMSESPPRGGPAAGWGQELRATLLLAWPLALTNLSQIALLLTDTFFLGRLGELPLAAATLGGNLYYITLSPLFGLAFAASAMLAQERGRRTHHLREMRRSFRQAGWAGALLLPPIALLLWFSGTLLVWSGQQPALAAEAQTYARILILGIPAMYGFLLLRGFLSALERPNAALWVAMAAILVNAALLWLTVAGGLGIPSMGVVGAGISTVVAEFFMLGGLAILVMRDRQFRRFQLMGRFWRADWRRLRELFGIGLPIAGSMLLEIGIFSATALVMGWFSTGAVAAHAVALQIAGASFMVPMGVGQAATARVGLAAGARDARAAQRAGWTAIGLSAAFMALAALILLTLPQHIAGLFLAQASPETLQLASLLLMVAGVFQLADGVQATAAGALRGLKDTRLPLLFAALGYWGLSLPIGLGLGFSLGLGPIGVWIGLACGLGVVAVLMTLRWARLAASGGRAPRRRLQWRRSAA